MGGGLRLGLVGGVGRGGVPGGRVGGAVEVGGQVGVEVEGEGEGEAVVVVVGVGVEGGLECCV